MQNRLSILNAKHTWIKASNTTSFFYNKYLQPCYYPKTLTETSSTKIELLYLWQKDKIVEKVEKIINGKVPQETFIWLFCAKYNSKYFLYCVSLLQSISVSKFERTLAWSLILNGWMTCLRRVRKLEEFWWIVTWWDWTAMGKLE